MLFDLDEEHSTSGSPRHTSAAAAVPASSSSGHRHSTLQPGLQASGSYESDRSSPVPLGEGSSKRRGMQWAAGVHGSYAESVAVSTFMGPGAQMMAASLDPSHFVMTGFTKPGKRQSGRKPPRPHRLKKTGRVCMASVAGFPLPLYLAFPLLHHINLKQHHLMCHATTPYDAPSRGVPCDLLCTCSTYV